MDKGIVIKSTGSWVIVRNESGDRVNCRLRGNFRQKNLKTTNPIAVGDKVSYTKEEDGNGIIQSIEPRYNYIIRKSVNLSKREHILAANIDQAVLFITQKHPVTYMGFIDRFLVTAEAYHIPVLLIFNKIDIYNEEELKKLNEIRQLYTDIGYECISCNATDKNEVMALKDRFTKKISLFSGHSGAGKSTFINSLDPKMQLKTGDISEYHQSGKHTTTFAEMMELSDDIFIVDSPGIKGLGIIDIPKETLSHYYPEFRKLIDECKFHNCTHQNEPGCAVKQALEKGKLSESRYKSYISILTDDDDETYRTVNY